MRAAAAKIGEASRWVATLSLDEPDAELRPWRLFCATGWHQSAVTEALPPAHLPAPPRPAPAEEPTS